MKTNIPSNAEVVIVGAGPAGLAAACALRKHHIKIVILDSAPEPSTYSRATVIHSSTLKSLETIDVARVVLTAGVPISAVNAWTRNAYLGKLPIRQKGGADATTVAMPQSELERILACRLELLGGIFVRGATVSDIVELKENVQLVVVGAAGTQTTITASYVIAADGLHSVIRSRLGIPYEGGDYEDTMLAVDCKLATSGKFTLTANEASVCFGADGLVIIIPETRDVWRILFPMSNPPKVIDCAQLQKLLRGRAPPGVEVKDISWSNGFRVHHRHATTYRKGRTFLIGDAAHTYSPAGGQGMNMGVQEGVELAQLLHIAIKEMYGVGPELDRYEATRRPVADAAMSMTHKYSTVGQWRSSWARRARDWYVQLYLQIAGLPLDKGSETSLSEIEFP